MTRTAPLLLFVIDCGSEQVCRELAASGQAPFFARLLRENSHHQLISDSELCAEPGIVRSMLSGASRDRHQAYYFRQLTPGTLELKAFAAPQMAATAPLMWSDFLARRKRAIVIDCPEAEPIEGIGPQAVNFHTEETPITARPLLTEPPALAEELQREFGAKDHIQEFRPRATTADDAKDIAKLRACIERKVALARRFLQQEPDPNLVVVGFHEWHVAMHRFWTRRGKSETGPAAGGVDEIGTAMSSSMQAIAAMLPNAQVALLSGFEIRNQFPMEGINRAIPIRLGYQRTAAHTPASGFKKLIGGARRLLGEPETFAAQEAALRDRFRNRTDWTRTRLFSIPSLYMGFFRVNLRGREPHGIVQPGTGYEALLAEFIRDLEALRDPERGTPMIAKIHVPARHQRQAPDHLPDVMVEWVDSSKFQRVITHPKCSLHQSPIAYMRDTFHRFQGFALLPKGPLADGNETLPVLHVTPKLRAMIGLPRMESASRP